MKIKDLPQNKSIRGIAFRHPETGKKAYWHSQWQNGVWYKEDPASERVFPLSVNDLSEALEFEVL